jgi:HEAT repeat protein
MRTTSSALALVAVLLLTASSWPGGAGRASAFLGSPLRVKPLIEAADTILLGDVVSVTPDGQAICTLGDSDYTRPVLEARLRVQAVPKGEAPAEEVTIRFPSNDLLVLPIEFESMAEGDHCLAFLKTVAPGTYEFASLAHGKVLVSAEEPERLPSGTPERAVEEVLIASLEGPDPQVVVSCIRLLPEIGGDAARDALWKLAQRRDETDRAVRGYALASLLQLDYVPAAEEAAEFLKEPTWSRRVEGAKGRILQGFRETRNPGFIPQLRLLSAPDDPRARENAVYALREMRDPSSIPWLVQALDDSSPEVRHLAMMGLADALGRGGEWTIDVPGFKERGDELIAKWKQWWREEGMKKYAAP